MRRMAWTARTEELLTSLAHQVPFLSLSQIARTWWAGTPSGVAAARCHLRRLSDAGFLARREVLAHPELPLREPLFRWRPGDPGPDCWQLSYACQSRWIYPVERVSVWVATERAAAVLGGYGGRISAAHATHDLHVGALYCSHLRRDAGLMQAWIPEQRQAARPNERMPDALLVGTDGAPRLAVEFGGAAKPHRIAKLHAWGLRFGVGYELW